LKSYRTSTHSGDGARNRDGSRPCLARSQGTAISL
jgi:hypothetical protein